MSDKPDLRTLLEVQDYFALPSAALVEKDWFVVRALAAIHDVEVDGLTLAFGGGTALGRAYRLLERMSEDIDLRIVGENAGGRGSLKRMRRAVSKRLEDAGFAIEGHVRVLQNGSYVRYDLPYDPIAKGEGVLRPEIKIEIAAFPICTAPELCSVISFVGLVLPLPGMSRSTIRWSVISMTFHAWTVSMTSVQRLRLHWTRWRPSQKATGRTNIPTTSQILALRHSKRST